MIAQIVLAAVHQNGGALEYASQALRNDSEIVLAAVIRMVMHMHASQDISMDSAI